MLKVIDLGASLNGMAFILAIVSVIIPNWFHWSTTVLGLPVSIKFGIWKCCMEVPTLDSECIDLEDVIGHPVSNEIRVTPALEILSLLAMFMAGGLVLPVIVSRKVKRNLLLASGMTAGVAGLLAVAGAIVFVINNSVETYLEENALNGQTDLKPDAGFAMCIVSGILSLSAAFLYTVASCCNTSRVSSTGT